jgi:uncharacterized protein (TIGR00725 family)
MLVPPVVTVFGSARVKPGDPQFEFAREVGALIARHGATLRNGGYGGTMLASAMGARAAGGKVEGVTLKAFGQGNEYLNSEMQAASIFERITHLMKGASALLVLPGGTGTLLELAAAMEHQAKGLTEDPTEIWLAGAYWKPVIETVMGEMQSDRDNPVKGRPASPLVQRLVFLESLDDCERALARIMRR